MEDDYYIGTVESVSAPEPTDLAPFDNTSQKIITRIQGGSAPMSVTAEYSDNPATVADDLQVGDRIVLYKTDAFAGEERYVVAEPYRLPSLAILLVVFFLLAMIFAGKRGLTAILGLAISIAILIWYTIPQIVGGASPFAIATISAFAIAIVSLTVAHGFSRHTGVALFSTLVTLTISLGLSQIFVNTSKLFGMGTEEAAALTFAGLGTIDVHGLLLAGIVIGVMGVLDDVTTAQTAAIRNVAEAGVKKWRDLYRAGRNVGREHIASLVNTLALAYAGVSLPLLLMFSVNEGRVPFWVMVNSEFIAEEIVRALIGSSALILAVPIASLAASWFYSKYSSTV